MKRALEKILITGTDEAVARRYATLATRAQDARFGLDEAEVVVLDTETTGYDPTSEEIIEIAGSIMKGPLVLETYDTFVNPQKHIPTQITDLTSIDDAMVAAAPTIDVALRDFARFCGDRPLIAHNASFDEGFIMKNARAGEFSGDWLDSLELARIALPRLRTHALSALCAAFETAASSHRASDDVAALCGVWRVLLVALSDLPPGLVGLIAELRPETDWPLRKVFSHLAAADPDARFSLRESRAACVISSSAPDKDDAERCGKEFPSEREVASCFGAESLIERMYPEYESRDEQMQMASAVIEAFRHGEVFSIEAGTGVGKSMAYLIPAALSAQRMGIAIGVATKTNALTDQLIYHELPALASVLPDPLRYVALKGYDHYPCLHKLEHFAAEEPLQVDEKTQKRAREDLLIAAMVYTFVSQTSWGDTDAMNLYPREALRSRVMATPDECLHRHCPYYPKRCYLHGLRQLAKSADIVITNHALLFRDVVAEGGILPPIRYWIVDEAHAVEEEARKQLSPRVQVSDLVSTLRTLGAPHAGVLAAVSRKARTQSNTSTLDSGLLQIQQQLQTVDNLTASFFSFVKDLEALAEKSDYDFVDLWVDEGVRADGLWGPVSVTGRALCGRLRQLVVSCRELISLMADSTGETEDIHNEFVGIANTLDEIREAIELFLSGDDKAYCYAVNICRNPDRQQETLSATLLDVGEVLAREFYPTMMSVVYTSATIATGASFTHFEHSVGIDLLPSEATGHLQLASSYDFDTNMKVLVPNDIPEPNKKGYLASLEHLLYEVQLAMGGSVLTLFTNRREMEMLYGRLKEPLARKDIRLLCQLKGSSSKNLREEFLAGETTCLFALKSFWEGFDAPGDTLRCVVITRLPFMRPNDPLLKERSARDRRAWGTYVLPEAVISLKQASGRLIRTSTDHGFLVLADSRLLTRPYGREFLSALPSQNQFMMDTDGICSMIRRGFD